MKLKKAVIKTMSRDDLKAVVDSLDITTVDRRDRNSMAKSVGRRQDIDANPRRQARINNQSIMKCVVVQELVHLRQAYHTPEFWKGVERAMPDFESRKQWLAENGAGYVAV